MSYEMNAPTGAYYTIFALFGVFVCAGAISLGIAQKNDMDRYAQFAKLDLSGEHYTVPVGGSITLPSGQALTYAGIDFDGGGDFLLHLYAPARGSLFDKGKSVLTGSFKATFVVHETPSSDGIYGGPFDLREGLGIPAKIYVISATDKRLGFVLYK